MDYVRGRMFSDLLLLIPLQIAEGLGSRAWKYQVLVTDKIVSNCGY
jgi:hypothetical protein